MFRSFRKKYLIVKYKGHLIPSGKTEQNQSVDKPKNPLYIKKKNTSPSLFNQGIFSLSYYLPQLQPHTMKLNSAFAATIISLAEANAIPADTTNLKALSRRDPEDKSGNSQFVLTGDNQTLRVSGGASGEGEGGDSNQHSGLYFNAQGTKIEADPDQCTYDGYYCNNCLFSGNGLRSTYNVTGCYNAAGGDRGCAVQFKYGGTDYNNDDGVPSCGHEDQNVPFGAHVSAICYFDG